jgi:hypothetical protein
MPCGRQPERGRPHRRLDRRRPEPQHVGEARVFTRVPPKRNGEVASSTTPTPTEPVGQISRQSQARDERDWEFAHVRVPKRLMNPTKGY